MPIKVYLIFLFILLQTIAVSQNLVPNPSFEEYKKCPISSPIPPNTCRYDCGYSGAYGLNIPQFGKIIQVSGATAWRAVNQHPVNYFNDCNITHNPLSQTDLTKWYSPRTGNAFISLYTFGKFQQGTTIEELRSYATVKLKQPLESGCKYEVEFYAKLGYCPAPSVWHYYLPSDGLSAYLSVDSLYDDQTHPAYLYHITPQLDFPGHLITDSTNYVRISGIITALGGEQYLTIGNFRDNAHTLLGKAPYDNGIGASYFIDDVSVTKITPQMVIGTGKDTTICKNSSVILEATNGFDNYTWSTGSSALYIATDTAGKFWVKGNFGCITDSDTIEVFIQEPFTEPFKIMGDTFLCNIPIGGYEIQASQGYSTYTWSTGTKINKCKIYEEGKYIVKASYACGIESDSITIDIYAPPASLIIPAVNDTIICEGSSVVLQTLPDFNNHFWNTEKDDRNDPLITVNEEKLYYVKADSPSGCEVIDSIKVTILALPELSLGQDIKTCDGLVVQLTAEIKSAKIFLWDNGSTNSKREISISGLYWAKAENKCGNVSDSININLLDCHVFIPNLVTANGDNQNDELQILTAIPRPMRIEIYNRWGQKVYDADEYNNDWGNQVESGIYHYHLYDILLNKSYNGWIEILR